MPYVLTATYWPGVADMSTPARPPLDKLLTIYGRKPVLEALLDNSLDLYRLHLADSNKASGIIDQITALAHKRNVEIRHHDKLALSRISKNSQQDQGVALDIFLPGFTSDREFFAQHRDNTPVQLLALDGVTNPQNLGMVIRSVCASAMDGLLLPRKGCASLDALVIKASAGTVFRASIIHCDQLETALEQLSGKVDIMVLDSAAPVSLFDYRPQRSTIYVLGNETTGISPTIRRLATGSLYVPMRRGVESLNVAAAATVVAFAQNLLPATRH